MFLFTSLFSFFIWVGFRRLLFSKKAMNLLRDLLFPTDWSFLQLSLSLKREVWCMLVLRFYLLTKEWEAIFALKSSSSIERQWRFETSNRFLFVFCWINEDGLRYFISVSFPNFYLLELAIFMYFVSKSESMKLKR